MLRLMWRTNGTDIRPREIGVGACDCGILADVLTGWEVVCCAEPALRSSAAVPDSAAFFI